MLHYTQGYKYRVEADYTNFIPVFPDSDIITPFYEIHTDGRIVVRAGYAWDGSSGPTVDCPADMAPSLEHDVCAQAMREERLDRKWENTTDDWYAKHCKLNGMDAARARIRRFFLRRFTFYTDPKNKRKTLIVPQTSRGGKK